MADSQSLWTAMEDDYFDWKIAPQEEQAAGAEMAQDGFVSSAAEGWYFGQGNGDMLWDEAEAFTMPTAMPGGPELALQGVQQALFPYAYPEQAQIQQTSPGIAQQNVNPAGRELERRLDGGDQFLVPQPKMQLERRPGNLHDHSNWTYAVEVWPAADEVRGQSEVASHILAIQEALQKKGIEYGFAFTSPVGDPHGLCRRYTVPQRHRFNDRLRLYFLQTFGTNRPHNQTLPGYRFKMSVVFENRSALRNDPYSTVVDDGDLVEDGDRRFSPNVVPDLIGFPSDENPMLPASPDSSGIMNMPQTPERRLSPPARAETDPASPLRMRPIAKPQRQATKNLDGKYCCTFPGCTEPVKQFGRKCEWSKHMDKHDRPYKCPAEGCENLPGFTYSGGLLRHEREVHGKHGGPKNPLNCPHLNCKRHTGKGFSRLENLNEHLRRVHTPGNSGPPSVEGEPDEFVALRALETPAPAVVAVNGGAPAPSPGGVGVAAGSEKTGEKRKADTDLHDQVKRLQMENQHLRSQVEAQKRQQIAMMEQMQELREHLEGRAGLRLVGANDPVVGGDSSED